MIVYTLTLPVADNTDAPRTMRVERWETVPATGLWNWVRRRRTITKKTLLGIFVVSGYMEITRRLNGPDTFSATYRGTDPSVLLLARPWPEPKMEEIR